MSDHERPELVACRELEGLVRHLGEELATFRQRTLQAEARLKAVEAKGTSLGDMERFEALEAENASLRRQLSTAARRAESMLERVRFLRQQHDQSNAGARGGAER